MKPAWIKILSTVLGATLAVAVAISQMSCLTPAQRQALANAQTTQAASVATIGQLKAEAEKYKADAAAALAKAKAGELPAEEAKRLAQTALANWDTTTAALSAAQQRYTEIGSTIAELKDSGLPWHYWLLLGLPAALSVAAIFVPGLSPLAAAAQNATAGLATQKEIGGSLSRTLDTFAAQATQVITKLPAGTSAEDALAQLKQELMHAEQARDELAVQSDYDQLRVLAKAGQV